MLDCIDDDQQLLLMATRQRPDLFEIHISDWFLPLKEFGAGHLTIKNKVDNKMTIKQMLVNEKQILQYLIRLRKRIKELR